MTFYKTLQLLQYAQLDKVLSMNQHEAPTPKPHKK